MKPNTKQDKVQFLSLLMSGKVDIDANDQDLESRLDRLTKVELTRMAGIHWKYQAGPQAFPSDQSMSREDRQFVNSIRKAVQDRPEGYGLIKT